MTEELQRGHSWPCFQSLGKQAVINAVHGCCR